MILVVVAHADDETLGMGGTIALTPGVRVAMFTDGVGARSETPQAELLAAVKHRGKCCARALYTLGVQGMPIVAAGNWPDNAIDAVPRLRAAKAIEQIMESSGVPDAIYTHSMSDLNVDHRRVAEAVLCATRPGGQFPVRDIYAMEVPSSTEWSFGQLATFQPNVFVDITETINIKLAAIACYTEEIRESPHPRSPEMLRARAAYWGSVAGCAYAEPFQLIRSLR